MITKKLYLGFVFFHASSCEEPADRLACQLPGREEIVAHVCKGLIAILHDHKCKYSEISISANIANQQQPDSGLKQELTGRDRNVLSLLQ